MIEKQDITNVIRQLPHIPQAVMELQRLLASPNVSVEQVDKVIRTDPALTASILRLANSAAFGLSRKISDIPQAITLMGFRVLGNLVHTAAFSKAIPAEFPGYRLTATQFLRHSFVVGVLSEALAAALRQPTHLPFFTAGLLHDIGKLVLGSFVASHKGELSELLESEQLAFVAVERRVLGVDHGEVASWVGEHWRLPAELVAAAEYHHQPDLALPEFQSLTDIVHVADVTAHCMGFGADLGELARTIHRTAFERLHLNAEVIEKVVSKATERLVQDLPTDEVGVPKSKRVRKLQILVVDDSSITRQMVVKSLGLAGVPPHIVVEASDGEEALSIMRTRDSAFDLVLADIHMPKMSGTQLVRVMSEDDKLKKIPVIVISSDGNSANHELLRMLGVRALLKKPFRAEQFRTVVQPVLNEQMVQQ